MRYLLWKKATRGGSNCVNGSSTRERLTEDHGVLRDASGKVLFCCGPGWTFRWAVASVFAPLKKGESVTIAIATDADGCSRCRQMR